MIGKFKNRVSKDLLLALVAMMASGSAFAELPPEAIQAIADLKSDTTALSAEFWPYLLLVFGGLTLMKLFKKFGNRAT